MNVWSIKKKLITLSTGLIGLTLIVAAVQMQGIFRIIKAKDDITDVQLPSVRMVNQLDVRHSGTRGDIFRSLYYAEHGTLEERKAVAKDLEEDVKLLKQYVFAFDKIQLAPEVVKRVDELKGAGAEYVALAEEVGEIANGGDWKSATARMADFQKAYDGMDKAMENLGKEIEVQVKKSDDGCDAIQSMTLFAGICLILVGLAGGISGAAVVIRNLVRTLNSVIKDLTVASTEVSGASEQTSTSSTELSEAATEQAAGLQETMASVEEISAMVNQNAESAARVKTAVELNQVASNEGEKNVADMLVAIDDIKATNDKILSQMEQSNREFGEIVKIISEIGDKTKVINDIVFQTKLLSFNASVEAARAGEHGKGFAVVAEEVGNLAQMSGNAAKQITDMLSGSIKKVNEIVDHTTRQVDQLVEVGKDKISMGQSTAQRCREALAKIAENARSVTEMVNEITHASKEQAQGVQEINKAMGQLDQVTQRNSAVAQASSQQAETLHAQAVELSRVVTSLALVVMGSSNKKKKDAAEAEVQAAAPVAGKPVANVIPISKAKAKVNKPAARKTAPVKMKMAAGDSAVPSQDDPDFQDF